MAEMTLHPFAQQEYQSAVAWYQERSAASAERFASEVERVLADIAATPERFGFHNEEFREAIVRRYPYSVIFKVTESDAVFVIAVAHSSREPDYWKNRGRPV